MAQKTTKAALAPGVDAETAKRLLHQMMLIRRFEEKAAENYALGKIGGFLHLSIGEEAVAAAEVAVGLAIIVAIFRLRRRLSVDDLSVMRW